MNRLFMNRLLMLPAVWVVCLLLSCASPGQNLESGPSVVVSGGEVQGKRAPNGRLDFLGIPFAQPPLGELRWQPPVPAQWSGVVQVTEPAAPCIQNDFGWNHADFLIGKEDCLTLDVGTTSLTGKRPVLVWIHGGSNRAGSPGGMTTTPMVESGIVVVGIRYRLGILGFLSHPELAQTQGGNSGNYGLMDQIAALRWVKDNIARFGGDPNDITIAGESAGSQDVGLLLAAPEAHGLFQKAAMESGTPGFGMPFRSLHEALAIAQQLEDIMPSGATLAALRQAPVQTLLNADLRLHDDAIADDSYLWLRTTLDGAVLNKSPDTLLREAPPKPVIIGSNRFELDLPGGPPRREFFMAKAFGQHLAQAKNLYGYKQGQVAAHPRLGTPDQRMATDVTFRCPARYMAALLADRAWPVWLYEFDASPAGGMTQHAIEIPYIFANTRLADPKAPTLTRYWINLVKTGNPNGTGLPPWPAFDPALPAHILFADAGVSAVTDDVAIQPCQFLQGL